MDWNWDDELHLVALPALDCVDSELVIPLREAKDILTKLQSSLSLTEAREETVEAHSETHAWIDKYNETTEALKVVKSWQGVMHTPAYGEWNEHGYWQRGAHCLGPPQIEVMCNEILDALKAVAVNLSPPPQSEPDA